MALDVTIALTAPPLPDVGVWFANAAAFNQYITTISGTATINPIANDLYAPVAYVESPPAGINIDGVDYLLVTVTMLQSLKAQIDALDSSYQELRTKLKAGGLIVEAQ